jgi:hypothetical protein
MQRMKSIYKPIHVPSIENYKDLIGQYIHVDHAEKIWSTNRKHLNKDCKILVTPQIVQFIEHLCANFVGDEFIWDGLLLKGFYLHKHIES